ncbi:MAG: alpha/beta hydrolase, partial [Chloroflexota bacterium]
DDRTGRSVSIAMGTFDLKLVTAQGIGSRGFTSKLPARYAAMVRGDFSWLAEEVLRQRRAWFGNAMTYVMDCASGLSPERAERVRQEMAESLLGDLVDFPFPDICTAWGVTDLGPDFRAPVHADVPALFISGTLDGRTPASNAEEVGAGFPHSRHLIVEGASHATSELATAPGVQEAMVAFLAGHPVTIAHTMIPFAFAPLDNTVVA